MGTILKLFLISFISTNIIFAVIDDKDKYGKEITLKEKTNISDTNPLSPGNPREARPAMRKAMATRGIRLASPPRSGM